MLLWGFETIFTSQTGYFGSVQGIPWGYSLVVRKRLQCDVIFYKANDCWKNTASELLRLINAHKILRYTLSQAQVTVEAELGRVSIYTKHYFAGLPLGASLPSTELQHADDLALLAGNTYVNLWKLTSNDHYLFNAIYLLEFALTKSKQSFLMRLILIRIYRLLGKRLTSMVILMCTEYFL